MKIKPNEKTEQTIREISERAYNAFMAEVRKTCDDLPDGDIQNIIALNATINSISRLIAHIAISLKPEHRDVQMKAITSHILTDAFEMTQAHDDTPNTDS
jgi:hypothetical protein